MPELSGEDHETFVRLQALHATVAASKDSFLGLGPLLRIAGTLVFSTFTVIATSFVRSWFSA